MPIEKRTLGLVGWGENTRECSLHSSSPLEVPTLPPALGGRRGAVNIKARFLRYQRLNSAERGRLGAWSESPRGVNRLEEKDGGRSSHN